MFLCSSCYRNMHLKAVRSTRRASSSSNLPTWSKTMAGNEQMPGRVEVDAWVDDWLWFAITLLNLKSLHLLLTHTHLVPGCPPGPVSGERAAPGGRCVPGGERVRVCVSSPMRGSTLRYMNAYTRCTDVHAHTYAKACHACLYYTQHYTSYVWHKAGLWGHAALGRIRVMSWQSWRGFLHILFVRNYQGFSHSAEDSTICTSVEAWHMQIAARSGEISGWGS